MPRLLLLSTTTGYQLRSFGDAARALGVELVFATDRCHALDDPWRDDAIAVRFHDEDASLRAVAAAAAQRRFAGVIAVGDRPVVLAARIAAALGVPGNPVDAARASANKRLARDCFRAAGLAVPDYVPIRTTEDVERVASGLRYPVVLKPVGLSGSRGVIRADDRVSLSAAFRRVAALLARPEIRALRTGSEEDLLIESFIEGSEYAIEGVLTAGAFTPLAVFDKPDPLDGPFFEETIYVTPSRLGTADQRRVLAAVERGAAALGLRHGAIHAECRVNARGVYLLEVAARPIGGLCSRVLRFERVRSGAGRGDASPPGETVSLEHLLLRHAIDGDVSGLRRESRAAAVMMIPIPRRGVFRSVTGDEAARQVPGVEEIRITAKPDQLLEPLPEAGSYLGFIFARASEAGEAEAALRRAHRHLSFAVDPAIDVRAG